MFRKRWHLPPRMGWRSPGSKPAELCMSSTGCALNDLSVSGYVETMVVRIGTSGWSYDHWKGVLYESGLPSAKRLAAYVQGFDTVELNASFYRWPSDQTFAGWRAQMPAGFAMSVKAPRGLTHARMLRSPEEWIERITRGWHALGDRGGALLVQLPPTLQRDDDRLRGVLSRLPADMPVAVEFRHQSWDDPTVYGLLAHYGASYVVMSGPGLPCVLRADVPLVYVRLHGPDRDSRYVGSYRQDELRGWADQVYEWHRQHHDVLVYFNNDLEGHAVRNARALKEMLNDAGVFQEAHCG
jgi:uncharacterized protein YecE (DUF72 family)